MSSNILQLGAVAIIFLFAIKEFFAYLKAKKNGNGAENSKFNEAILLELQRMNSNHLHSIQEAIEKGNERLVDVIHGDNVKMIEILGELKGLSRK